MNTYESVLELVSNTNNPYSIIKQFGVSNYEGLYLKFKNKPTCIYCGSDNVKFISFKEGYKQTCNSKECVGKLISSKVTQTHQSRSKEEKDVWKQNIKDNQKQHSTIVDKEYLLQTYPNELNEDMSIEEIESFYNKHKSKTKHISAILKIFWGCETRKDLYDKLCGVEHCSICGNESMFIERKFKYSKTCSEECNRQLITKNSPDKKGVPLTVEQRLNLKSKAEERSFTNTQDLNEDYWKVNFIEPNGLFNEDKVSLHHNMSKMTIYRHKLLFNIENSNIQKKCVAQREIYDFVVEHYQGLVLFNDRKAIKPLELDIYLPQLNFAIEYNGMLSHSTGKHTLSMYNTDSFSNDTPEYDKLELCEERGISLYNINENEWTNPIKRDIWKSMLLNKMNLTPNKVYARQTEIREVSFEESSRFLQTNHIQGACVSKVRIGLYRGDGLLFLTTFGKSRYNSTEIELIRSCSKKYTNVIGGFSKLVKYYRENYGSFVSYANRRWSSGLVYAKNGFEFLHKTNPGFFYLNNKLEPINRLQLRKSELLKAYPHLDKDKTANVLLYELGYRKMYDCGNLKFVLS